MRNVYIALRGRPLQLYLLGHAVVLVGAWSMSAFDSMVPMALAASAGLMLSSPLLRQLVARARNNDRRHRSK